LLVLSRYRYSQPSSVPGRIGFAPIEVA